MSMYSDSFRFHYSESMDCNLNLQSDNPFQLPNSIGDAPNYYNFTPAHYPFPSPLPFGGYEGFLTGTNNSTSGGSQAASHNVLNKETSASGSGTKSAAIKHKRSQRQCKSFGNRSSMYRGVTKYENGRCEAFVWDNTDPEEKAKTTYVGGFEEEEHAARAHDLAALKLWGESAQLNFPLSHYENEMEDMKAFSKKDYFLHIRRKTSFAKGISNYRGVSKSGDSKKWQVRLGKGKDMHSIYVGTFDTKEEAARAYDIATIRVRGRKAITNFDINKYDVQQILDSSKFPIENGASKTLRRSSVDDVFRKRRKTRNIPLLKLNVDSSGSPSLNPSAPPSFQPIIPTQTTTIDSNSHSQSPIPFLQLPVPHGYQIPTFQANPSFNPPLKYGGGERMEPTVQFQPILPSENPDFPFQQYYNKDSQHYLYQHPSSHQQYYNKDSQHHLYQHPSSQLLQDTHNPNSQQTPNFVAGWSNLASNSYISRCTTSQVPDASLETMGTNKRTNGDGSNEMNGNLGYPDYGLGNSEWDPSTWLDMFLMSSHSDSNV